MTLFRTKPWQFRGRRTDRNAPQGYRCDDTCAHPAVTLNTKICLCAVCHEVFSTPRHFDRHRSNGWCLDPAALGLERNERGVWRETMDPEKLNRLSGRFGEDDEDDD